MEFARKALQTILALSAILGIGCQTSPDFEALKEEILNLHEQEIEAHWKKDVDFFVRDLSENYMSVSRGEIRRPTVEEIRTTFASYLNHTTFLEYRDMRQPMVGFSRDGSMAWSVVQVKVVGKRTMEDGSERDLDFVCAWITLYERENGRWVRLGEVSSFK